MSFMKGNRMYNQPRAQYSFPSSLAPRHPVQTRIAIGSTGQLRAAELIRQGRARRIGVGAFNCPTSATIPTCAPPVQVCPENQKRYVMPFIPDATFTASVPAGQLVRFVGKPQKMFKPDRLIIASSIGPFFDVVNLIIGNIPQSLAQGNVSAEMFSEVATYVMMSFDQAYPGIDISITAQNKSSVTQTFQAQLIGEAIG